ncbi:MAG TPA: hypothetical protein VMT46_01280 [Anaerolineaceae bacterium]|nr:hypothetical protein [Anaerolineaceae bacterium]
MDTSVLSWGGVAILVILLLIGLSLLVLYYIPRVWKKRSAVEIKQIGSRIRSLEGRLKQARTTAQDYSPDDPEPYGPVARSLFAEIDQVGARLQELQKEYGEIHQAIRHVDQYPSYQVFLTAVEWYQVRQQIKILRKSARDIDEQNSALDRILQRLRRQIWETALQARQARQDLVETNQVLQFLKTTNTTGASYEKLLRQKSIVQIALDNIPDHFISGNEDELIEQKDKEGVVQVHQVLVDHHSSLKEINRQFNAWKSQYEDSQKLMDQVHSQIEAVRQKMANAPANLLLTPIESRLNQVDAAYQALEDRLAKPDPDEFKSINREASLLARTAGDVDAQFDRAVEQLSLLVKTMRELVHTVNQLSQSMGDLAKRETYPVDWDIDYARLTTLRKEVKTLGSSNDPRSPEQIDRDLEQIRQLQARLGEIDQATVITSRQHQEVLAILETLNLEASLAWGLNTRRLAEQVSQYDPENWTQKNSVTELANSAENLLLQLKETVPADNKKPIKESRMAGLLDRLRQISEFYVSLQNQEDRIRHRFQEIQALEVGAEETLNRCRSYLKQIALVIKSNPFLQKLAVNQVDQFQTEGERLSVDLADRGHGLVQRKYQQINEYTGRLEVASNQWLFTLLNEINNQKTDIGSRLNTLKEIGAVDEPVVKEAADLLAQLADTAGSNSKKELLPASEITLQVKYRSEQWQRCVATNRALAEIETPLLEAHQKAEAAREAAGGILSEASRTVPGQQSWPPSSQSIQASINDFNELDKQWDELRQKPNRALNLVSRLGEFTSRYHTISERIQAMADRAQEEQNRVRDLENQFNESVQMWRYQMRANSASPQAMSEIQKLVDDAIRDLNTLKQQARQGGKGYQQIVQDLILLSRRVNSATISIDDQQKIDINGETRINRGFPG